MSFTVAQVDTIRNIYGSLFLVLGIVVILIAIYQYCQTRTTSLTKIVLILIPIVCFSRGIMILQLKKKDLFVSLSSQPWIQTFFSGLCGYLTVSIYTLIIVFWAVLLYEMNTGAMNFLPLVRKLCIICNLVIYVIWGLFLILIFTSPSSDNTHFWHMMEATFATALSFAVAIITLILGYSLVRRLTTLNNNTMTASERKKLYRRKTINLTVVLVFTFVARGISIGTSMVVTDPLNAGMVECLGWLFGELIPHLLNTFIIVSEGYERDSMGVTLR